MKDLRELGAWAVVIGGSTTIGEQFVRQTAAAGMNVVLVARRAELLETLAAEVRAQHGVEARPLAMDLLVDGAIDRLVAEVEGLDVGLVVVNANLHKVGLFERMSLDTKRRMIQMNVQLPLEVAHAFAPRFARQGRGGLLYVNALNALSPIEIDGVFQGTKAFLLLLVESLWTEYRRHGVRVAATMVNGIEGSASYESKLSGASRRFASVIGGSMAPERIVEASLRGFLTDKPVIVPDYTLPINTVAYRLIGSLRGLSTRASTRLWSAVFSRLLDGDEVVS